MKKSQSSLQKLAQQLKERIAKDVILPNSIEAVTTPIKSAVYVMTNDTGISNTSLLRLFSIAEELGLKPFWLEPGHETIIIKFD